MIWKLGVATALALLVPLPRTTLPTTPTAPPSTATATVTAPIAPAPTAMQLEPLETWTSARDARALASDETHVWVATGGGVDRYARTTRERRHFGVRDGLDTVDIRTVDVGPQGVVAHTATARCTITHADHFTCAPTHPSAAKAANLTLFQGHPVAARLRVGNDEYVATRGGGAFFLPEGVASKATALAPIANDPASFVHTGAVFAGALWLGTFDDGLYRVPLGPDGRPTGALEDTARRAKSPARLVNRIVATTGKTPALFVGATEGLFVSRDGATFSRVDAIAAHAITGLATTEHHLWVTSTEALYRLPLSGRGPVLQSIVRPGASHAIQAVAVDESEAAWLATEDRGVVRVDPDHTIHTFDRVAGLPSSWFVGLDLDGRGGVIATSLRHGAVSLAHDGTWSKIDWAPSPWGLGARHDATRTCLATQGGATCSTKDGVLESLTHLPDPRVHVLLTLGPTTLVGTEAGVAVYPR